MMNDLENQLGQFGEDKPAPPNFEKVKNEFERIRKLGFIPCNRKNNKDGGIGNTFEDYLGVDENNLKDPDFEGFEVKTKRQYSSAYLSLFSKSPTFPKGANAYLKDKFGEVRDENFPDLKKLYASMFGHRYTTVYAKYKMKIFVDRGSESLKLLVLDLDENILSDQVYWSFSQLKKSCEKKLKNLFIVFAETKEIDGVRHYHYNMGKVFIEFEFHKLLNAIENGNIQFDFRMGVYNSGKNYGKPHDHGSGFRIKRENIEELFKYSVNL